MPYTVPHSMWYVRRLSLLLIVLVCVAYRPAATQAPSPSPSLSIRIIVVNSADEAQRIAERVRAGENFAVLAKTLSIDPSANDGGLIGPVDPSTLRPELRDALQGRRP